MRGGSFVSRKKHSKRPYFNVTGKAHLAKRHGMTPGGADVHFQVRTQSFVKLKQTGLIFIFLKLAALPKETWDLLTHLLLGSHLSEEERKKYLAPRGPTSFKPIVSLHLADRHLLLKKVVKRELTLTYASKQVKILF